AFLKRLFGGLYAGFETNQILNVFRELLVECDKKRNGLLLCTGDRLDIGVETRRQALLPEVGCQLVALPAFILERKGIGVGLEKEVERIDHRHFANDFNINRELARWL